MKYTGKDLRQAYRERAKAKNSFIELANNKESSKKDLLKTYKDFMKSDAHFIKIYEGVKYDKAA